MGTEDTGSDTRRAIVVLFDDLRRITTETLRSTLEENPVHRAAARDWLFMAAKVSPSALESVFPYLRLLVELDPDDLNTAALGVAYAGLGGAAWGKHLIEEAKHRSAVPAQIDRYEALVSR